MSELHILWISSLVFFYFSCVGQALISTKLSLGFVIFCSSYLSSVGFELRYRCAILSSFLLRRWQRSVVLHFFFIFWLRFPLFLSFCACGDLREISCSWFYCCGGKGSVPAWFFLHTFALFHWWRYQSSFSWVVCQKRNSKVQCCSL
uniref:Uncharacterized protein n=1 Tax=Physcomitrium patens TaxID=3218 RepID=A0A2K1IQ48_PHYPA|nr:hypothetical protein PHYPA_025537 [Physcomitrium patens]